MSLLNLRDSLLSKARAHLLDALDERGLISGLRLEFPQAGECRLVEFEQAMPGPGMLLLEMLYSVVSAGTERAAFTGGASFASYPFVPGYSGVGRVVLVGRGVSLQPGELVASTAPHASIHVCAAAPVLRLPLRVQPMEAAAFHMAVVALQGVRRAAIQPGDRVAVLGAGLIGQICAQASQRAGGQVQLVAASAVRLDLARSAGISDVTTIEDGDPALRPDADVVLDATGAAAGFAKALRVARTGARIVLVGSTRDICRGVDLDLASRKNLSILGAHTSTLPGSDDSVTRWTWRHEAETYLRLLDAGQLAVAPLLDQTILPSQAPEFYAALARGIDKAVGTVIDWTAPGPWRIRVERASPVRLLGAGLRRIAGVDRSAPAFLDPRTDGRRIRFGLIGCGEIAIANSAAIRASSNGTVSYTADPNFDLACRMAAATGAAATADVDALLNAPEVDAVVIATPHHLHAPLAIRAARAGKHVVVEKPMATTVADCDAMIAAADRAGVLLSVCYCQRFDPRVSAARRLLEGGVIGEVLGTRIAFGQQRESDYYGAGLGWRSLRPSAGGGVLIMNSCHLLDYVGWLVKSPVVEVVALAETQTHEIDVEDVISVSYRYGNHALGSLTATTSLTGPWLYEQALWGQDGQLQIAPEVRFWSRRTLDGHEAGRWHTVRRLPRGAERRHFFEAFAAAILDGLTPPAPGREAREVQAVISAAYDAIATGRNVRLA